jgi:hypothetical protein
MHGGAAAGAGAEPPAAQQRSYGEGFASGFAHFQDTQEFVDVSRVDAAVAAGGRQSQ